MKCRNCDSSLDLVMVDLGMSPLCESYLSRDQLGDMEPFYPLKVFTCTTCWLVQLDEFVSPADIFGDYAYFSSYSTTWLEHARNYADEMISTLRLDATSLVVELASNDGYLLRWFHERDIPVLGIEPAANVAADAVALGIPTQVEFFGKKVGEALASSRRSADLIVANNVLAQVPDLHDFVAGIAAALAKTGVVTIEYPHLQNLIAERQFDTIYHEHFSYFSLGATISILERHGLEVFHVERLETHGGSLRVYGHHRDDSRHVQDSVAAVLAGEDAFGLTSQQVYLDFGESARAVKRDLLRTLIDLKSNGRRIAGYGAAGKGNTLLNYCGIRTDFLDFIADRNPHKHGMYTPGTHIPILPPAAIEDASPDVVMILPWNIEKEIRRQLAFIAEAGGQFLIPIPRPALVGGLP